MGCSDYLRKSVLSIISSVMHFDTILNWMNIQTDIQRWWDTRKYSNVLKKFVSSWKHVRISIYKMTTDMKDVIL